VPEVGRGDLHTVSLGGVAVLWADLVGRVVGLGVAADWGQSARAGLFPWCRGLDGTVPAVGFCGRCSPLALRQGYTGRDLQER